MKKILVKNSVFEKIKELAKKQELSSSQMVEKAFADRENQGENQGKNDQEGKSKFDQEGGNDEIGYEQVIKGEDGELNILKQRFIKLFIELWEKSYLYDALKQKIRKKGQLSEEDFHL